MAIERRVEYEVWQYVPSDQLTPPRDRGEWRKVTGYNVLYTAHEFRNGEYDQEWQFPITELSMAKAIGDWWQEIYDRPVGYRVVTTTSEWTWIDE